MEHDAIARRATSARAPTIAAGDWLNRAAAMLSDHPDLVRAAATVRGFQGGGEWMALALAAARSEPPSKTQSRKRETPRFRALGLRKYGACLLAAGCAASISLPAGPACAIAAGLLLFYGVEARHVFDFPAAIDYGRRGRTAARALHRRAGGTISILTRLVPIVAFMLLGFVVIRRPRWNCVVGCMAVVLWYESLRRREDPTPCVFDLGSFAPLSVRRVGDSDQGPDSIRVLYASDLHLGSFGATRALRELQRVTVRERPDVVLLGGDLVDFASAIPELAHWVRRLSRVASVGAIPGNHDARWLEQVGTAVTNAGGHWLEHRPMLLRGLRIDGTPTRATSSGERRLLCAHHPALFPSAVAMGYDFVMAGHLHGGQMIVCDIRSRHYPGAIYSRWTGREFTAAQATMWVSRGLHDTLPIRVRCPREVLLATFRCDAR